MGDPPPKLLTDTEKEMETLMREIEAQELDLKALDPERETLAGLQAGRRIRTNPKKRIEDVDVFHIRIDPTARDYRKLMREVQTHIHSVQSMLLYGKPVTSPLVTLDEEQFYIVRVSKECDARFVDKLFRASDMYLLAFKPCDGKTEQPYFRFSDVELPSWITSFPLAHSSAHGKNLDTIFGVHWWDIIFETDLKCTKKNCRRHDATSSQWSILLLAEPSRLLSLQNDVVEVTTNGGTADIGCSEEGIHNWKTLSKVGFRYWLRPNFQKSMMLLQKYTNYKLYDKEKKKYLPWEIVGSRGEIQVFKYDHLLVMNIIKVQQDEVLKTLEILLQEQQLPSPSGMWKSRVHRSQHPNVPILLAYILVHGKEYSLEVRKAAGLLLRNIVPDDILSMVPADTDYIKSNLISCILEKNEVIRSTAQAGILTVLETIHAGNWFELIQSLKNCLDSKMQELMKGALEVLCKISFQMPHELESHVPGLPEVPVTIFLKRWLQLFKHPDSELRRLAIDCLNNCTITRPLLLNMHMDEYLDALFYLYEKNWAIKDENGWEERYAAAMTISTIAEECINRAHRGLPQVIQILTQLLREDGPSILRIACVTISKYSKYIVQRLSCQDGCKQFDEILQSLLERKAHSDKFVQRDASAALAEIEKEYSTLEGVISQLNRDMNPFALLWCLMSIAKAVRPEFSGFLVPMFREGTNLLGSQLSAEKGREKRISSGCLKLLSAVLAQWLPAGTECSSEIAPWMPAGFQNMIEESSLIYMLEKCCDDKDVDWDLDIEQSAVKLLEDLSKVVQDESQLAKVRTILAMYEEEEEEE